MTKTVYDPFATLQLSGRITLNFSPDEQILGVGWFGEYGADPTLPAPIVGVHTPDDELELLQYDPNPLMVSSLIDIDQAAGQIVVEYDWAGQGSCPP